MSEQRPLTVSALTDYIKYKFDNDQHLRDVFLEGEVSNFKQNVRGHFYFTLKDDHASIRAVMFRSRAQKVRTPPKDGSTVLVRGYVSIFKVAGSYQIYVERIEETGLGALYRRYLELKDRLEKEGYFAEDKKRPIPEYPRQIAVLTSATGAAVRDILNVINRRYPLVKVLVYPTTVQGERAAGEIVDNLRRADALEDTDTIIVVRGGGSIEDLWAFNEEVVAQAIFQSTTPIISAVGHETDFTIADFVADKRAPTPSAAAEMAVPDRRALLREVAKYTGRIEEALERQLRLAKRRLEDLKGRYVLQDPMRILEPFSLRLENLRRRLSALRPDKQLKQDRIRTEDFTRRLLRAQQQLLSKKRDALTNLDGQIKHLSPKGIMKKGYALVHQDGRLIKRAADLRLKEAFSVEFDDGVVDAEATDKKER